MLLIGNIRLNVKCKERALLSRRWLLEPEQSASRHDCLCVNLNLNTQNCQREPSDLISHTHTHIHKKTKKTKTRTRLPCSSVSTFHPGWNILRCFVLFFGGVFLVRFTEGFKSLLIMCDGKHRAKLIVIKTENRENQAASNWSSLNTNENPASADDLSCTWGLSQSKEATQSFTDMTLGY